MRHSLLGRLTLIHSMNLSITFALFTMVNSFNILDTTHVVTPFKNLIHSSIRGVRSVGLAACAYSQNSLN